MDKQTAYKIGVAFSKGRSFATGIAMDEERWITVHPNGKGKNADYQRLKIDDESGKIVGGMNFKYQGKTLAEAFGGKEDNKTGLQLTKKDDKITNSEGKTPPSPGANMTNTEIKPVTTRQDKLQKTIERYKERLAKFDFEKEKAKQLKDIRETAKWHAEFNNLPMPSEEQMQQAAERNAENKRKWIIEDMNNAIAKMDEAKRLDAKETEKKRKADNKSVFIAKLPPVLKEFRTAFMVDYAEALKEGRKEAKEWLKDNRDFPPFHAWYEDHKDDFDTKQYAYEYYKDQKSAFWNTYEHRRQQAHMTDDDIEAYAELGANECVFGLVQNVKKAVGEVTSLDNVHVTHGSKGRLAINGIVSGKEGKCRIESIYAGGYNIQRYHIRVLVHKIKKTK